jgi:hypothetical protein
VRLAADDRLIWIVQGLALATEAQHRTRANRPVRAVLDANVLISAILSPRGTPRRRRPASGDGRSTSRRGR